MIVQEYINSGAIEACILGVADAAEMQQYYTMRSQHSEVIAYATQFEEQLEQDYLQNASLVCHTVKQSVMQQITRGEVKTIDSPLFQKDTAAKVVPLTTTKKSVTWKYMAAAGVALFLASTIFSLMMVNKVKEQQTTIASLEKNKTNLDQFDFLKNPDVVPVAMNGVGIHAICKCSLYWDKKNKKAYFQIHHLVPPGADKGYQLWAMVDGKPVSVGMVPYNTDKHPVSLANVPDGASGFAVTREDAIGAAQPNPDTFLEGKI